MENETPLDTEPCWLDRDTHQFTIENRVCRVFNGGPQRFQPHTAGIETCPLPLCPCLSSSCKAGGLQRSIALRKLFFKEFSSQSQHGSFLSVLVSLSFSFSFPTRLYHTCPQVKYGVCWGTAEILRQLAKQNIYIF